MMNIVEHNTIGKKDSESQVDAWFQFSAVILSSAGCFLWVRHCRHVFNSIVEAHLRDQTYMVPLLGPLWLQMVACEIMVSFSFYSAIQLRHRPPRFVAAAVFIFSLVALVATMCTTTT